MGDMKFDVLEIKGGAGGRYRPILKCGKTVMPEEFLSVFSGTIKMSEPYASFILGSLRDTIAGLLQSGRPVNLGWVSFTPRLKGALGTTDAAGNPDRLEVVATPSRAFRHCLKEIDVINVNHISDPLLYELQEDDLNGLNALHRPGKRIVINGDNISIDTNHTDEGIWLENANGETIEKGTVIFSDRCTCYFKFGTLPKKRGTYIVVLSCRNGRGTDFKPKRVTRRVTVR